MLQHIKIPRNVAIKVARNSRILSTAAEVNESEYTETPQYPPILDISYQKVLERKKEAWYEEVKNVKTVEEKQIKLNMPKYYGFKCYMLWENKIPYNNLHFTQHITRTHLIEQNNLPSYYNNISTDHLLENLKSDVQEAILLEYEGYRKAYELSSESNFSEADKENILSRNISRQINRIFLNNLVSEYPHLDNLQVDFEPRVESFWYAGGMNPPENIKRYRRGKESRKHTENEPTNRAMQYIGSPNLTVRSDAPLPSVVPYSESENPSLDVPYFKYDPRVVGTSCEFRRITNIPGFWPGDPHQFGIISYSNRGHHLERYYDDPEDPKEALHRQGILATYGWLNSQANYLGFTTFNDITYPLTTQCIITNGKLWSIYIYQLNTILNHSKYVKENPKRNICWALETLKLFEEVKNSQIIGFNEDVLKLLLKLYVNTPKIPEGIDLRPYLSKEEKVVADYEDPDKRAWLEREFKFIMSNRPRHKLPFELYHWEKIYKVDHNTRPMDKRMRPFEFLKKPWDRRYDERLPEYIPRKLRPDLPRYKGRYAKEYFP